MLFCAGDGADDGACDGADDGACEGRGLPAGLAAGLAPAAGACDPPLAAESDLMYATNCTN